MVRNSKGNEIVALDGGQFLQFIDASKLNTICGALGTFNTRKTMFQPSRKTFSFLNYVNINSFQSYSLSIFILFVFLFLGLKYNGHKISIKVFVWLFFLMGFSLSTFFWLQILLVLLSGDVEINPGPKRTPKASLSIYHWNLNSISAHNYVKLSLLRAYLAFHKFDKLYTDRLVKTKMVFKHL